MADGNTYMLRNKLESDVGDAVDVTSMICLLDDVGMKLPQPARKNTVRTTLNAAPVFMVLRL